MAYAAGPRRVEPGDTEWPQLAYSGVNIGTTTGRLPEKPELLFDVTIDGSIAYTTPVVGAGKLFYPLYPGGLVALDAVTGRLVWQNKSIGNSKYGTAAYDEGGSSPWSSRRRSRRSWRSTRRPARCFGSGAAGFIGILKIDRGIVYISNGHVAALEAATGAVRWTSAEPCQSPPAIDGDRIYCLGDGELLALDAASGARMYAAPAATTDASVCSAPAVDGGRLYFVGARLYVHATADGAPLWDADFGAVHPGRAGEPDADVADGGLRQGDRWPDRAGFTRSTLERATSSGSPALIRPGSSVAVADGRVVVAGVVLLDADSGQELWSTGIDRYHLESDS